MRFCTAGLSYAGGAGACVACAVGRVDRGEEGAGGGAVVSEATWVVGATTAGSEGRLGPVGGRFLQARSR